MQVNHYKYKDCIDHITIKKLVNVLEKILFMFKSGVKYNGKAIWLNRKEA